MNADIVKLAGGGDVITDHARAHFEAGRPLGAIHLLDIAFYAAPDNANTLKVKKAALEHL